MAKELLSRQRKAVLVGLANGLSPREMAKAMHLTEGTVKTHIHWTLVKLGVHSRMHAVAMGVKLGIITARHIVLDGECPGTETEPNYCKCPCTGCKYNCGAHYVKDLDDDWR